jgi:DNA-binding PadR family transcriptional regulator
MIHGGRGGWRGRGQPDMGPGDRGFGPGGGGPGEPGSGSGCSGDPGFGPGGPHFGLGFGPGGRGFGMRMGGFGPGGPGFGFRGHRRRMRGDVRSAVLALLLEEPRHGYAVMSEIAERSAGVWRPSPGSVYPVLQQLQDEGLVAVAESEGRRVFSLTETGRAYVEEHREAIGRPWEMADSGPGRRTRALAEGMAALAAAVHQVAGLADDAQATRAAAALEETRRTMYRILAGDDPGASGEDARPGRPTSGGRGAGGPGSAGSGGEAASSPQGPSSDPPEGAGNGDLPG